MRALTLAGSSAPEIAQILGVTDRTVSRIRTRLGLTQPQDWRPMNDTDKQSATLLFDDGCSIAEVARTLGFCTSTIRRHFPGRCWTDQQSGRHAALVRWGR